MLTNVAAGNAQTAAGGAGVSLVYVSDTAANVVSNLSALSAIYAAGQLGGVAITGSGNTLTLTAAQWTQLSAFQNLVTGSYALDVTGMTAAGAVNLLSSQATAHAAVSDTPASVASSLDALNPLVARIDSISLLGSGTPQFIISPTQDATDGAAIAKLTAPYALLVSNVGSAGNVTLNGYGASSVTLTGGTGNDVFTNLGQTNTISGGGGFNVLVAGIASTAVTSLTQNPNGSWNVAVSGGGTATLSNIEEVRFTDKTVALQTVANNDFFSTGTSSLLTQDANGSLVAWNMSGNVAQSNSYIGSTVGYWSEVGTGDYFGNGSAGIMVEDSSGDLVAWNVVNGQLQSQSYVGTATNGWSYVNSGDYDGTGTDGVLLKNAAGSLVTWSLSNGQLTGAPTYVGTLGAGQSVVGSGDFLGDGKTDVLVEDALGNLSFIEKGSLGAVNPPQLIGMATNGWSFLGTGDFTGNGTTDILVQDAGHDIVSWTISKGAIVSTQYVGTMTSGWSYMGSAETNGSGPADILMQYTGATNGALQNGTVTAWNMSNDTLSGSPVTAGALTGSWKMLTPQN